MCYDKESINFPTYIRLIFGTLRLDYENERLRNKSNIFVIVTVASPVRARLCSRHFRSRDQRVFDYRSRKFYWIYARLASPLCPVRGPKAGQGNKVYILCPKFYKFPFISNFIFMRLYSVARQTFTSSH